MTTLPTPRACLSPRSVDSYSPARTPSLRARRPYGYSCDRAPKVASWSDTTATLSPCGCGSPSPRPMACPAASATTDSTCLIPPRNGESEQLWSTREPAAITLPLHATTSVGDRDASSTAPLAPERSSLGRSRAGCRSERRPPAADQRSSSRRTSHGLALSPTSRRAGTERATTASAPVAAPASLCLCHSAMAGLC